MSQKIFTPNTDPKHWHENHTDCNCGSFALNTSTWVAPYDNDDDYTEEYRQSLMLEMSNENFDREAIMEVVMLMDQQAILRACPWIEPVLPHEIKPTDRVVAYRLFLDSDALEMGDIDDDFHFRVRINGFWFEKCGQDPIRFCGTFDDKAPWHVTPYLVYDSEICYFRFKE